jgi:hypothetical protein
MACRAGRTEPVAARYQGHKQRSSGNRARQPAVNRSIMTDEQIAMRASHMGARLLPVRQAAQSAHGAQLVQEGQPASATRAPSQADVQPVPDHYAAQQNEAPVEQMQAQESDWCDMLA